MACGFSSDLGQGLGRIERLRLLEVFFLEVLLPFLSLCAALASGKHGDRGCFLWFVYFTYICFFSLRTQPYELLKKRIGEKIGLSQHQENDVIGMGCLKLRSSKFSSLSYFRRGCTIFGRRKGRFFVPFCGPGQKGTKNMQK